jgi:DNA-binding NarL/FixJ family response regulator
VLLDVMMPRMDGITALRILKQDPETRLIPVVLMTALSAVEDRVRGIEAGADDFLSKPVDDRELLARIKTALSVKRAIDATVDELRSTSAHLERYGNGEREIAALAVEWRPIDPSLPDEAVAFVARRRREAAEERIRARGGTLDEGDRDILVASFDDPDAGSRAVAAVGAALAVVGDDRPEAPRRVIASAAVGTGRARVGSRRVTDDGESRWVYGVEGEPVEGAVALARTATVTGVMVTAETAAFVSDRFRLEPVGEAGYRVMPPVPGRGAPEAVYPFPERRITTILVTDIVGSTETAERMGDSAWTELLAAHDRATRAELVRFGGKEMNTTGDGFIASFDAPARAIRCALAVMDRLDAFGLRIRAGVHTGEVEKIGRDVEGIAMNVASRVAALAGPAEVLVSATARELAAGSGLEFVDRGEHELKGLSEPRRLYSARENDASSEASETGDANERPAGLTPREVDVLRLVATGLSDAEAAERLFLSVRTVNAHLRSIYRKLGVSSRAAAGRFAHSHGLV